MHKNIISILILTSLILVGVACTAQEVDITADEKLALWGVGENTESATVPKGTVDETLPTEDKINTITDESTPSKKCPCPCNKSVF